MKNSLLFWLSLSLPLSFLSAQQTVGLFVQDSLAYQGYTLFAPTSSQTTYLIDNCGQEVNRWESTYFPGIVAYLLEDGSLLRTGKLSNSTFNGGGAGGQLERYDWDGNLVWSYRYSNAEHQQHHDIEFLPNGNIVVLAWEFFSTAEAIQAGRDPATLGTDGVWAEQVVELQPIGTDSATVVWEWHLWDHLIQDLDSTKDNFGIVSAEPGKVDVNYLGGIGGVNDRDWIHANSVDYHPERDELVLNSRQLGEMWIIDHSTSSEEAAADSGGNRGRGGEILYRWGNPQVYDRGTPADQRLFAAHDANWILPTFPGAGKIILYNNGENRSDSSFSTVEIIDPPLDSAGNYVLEPNFPFGPTTLSWLYPQVPSTSFYSRFISGAQRLSNGNTLICEGNDGRIFEVDLAGNLVWEYINPVGLGGAVSQGLPPNRNDVFRAYRYGADYPGLVGKDLPPGEPLEINPLPQDCELSTSLPAPFSELQIGPNPLQGSLSIRHLSGQAHQLTVWNMAGQLIQHTRIEGPEHQLSTEHWPRGVYLLQLTDTKSGQILRKRILK